MKVTIIMPTKREISFFFLGFAMSFCMVCLFIAAVGSGANSPPSTSVPTNVAPSTLPSLRESSTLTPTRTPKPIPTRTPVIEECYIEMVITDGQYATTVYLDIHGDDALLFCDILIEEGLPPASVYIVDSIPDFPVWCTYTRDGITLEVISEYRLFGEAACDGLNSPSSFNG